MSEQGESGRGLPEALRNVALVILAALTLGSAGALVASLLGQFRDVICSDGACAGPQRALTSTAALCGLLWIAFASRAQLSGIVVGTLTVFLGVIGAIATWPEFRLDVAQSSKNDQLLKRMQQAVGKAMTIAPQDVVGYAQELELENGVAAVKFTLDEPRRLRFELKIREEDRADAAAPNSDPVLELYRLSGDARTLLFSDDEGGALRFDAAKAAKLEGGKTYLAVALDEGRERPYGLLANVSAFDFLIADGDMRKLIPQDRQFTLASGDDELRVPRRVVEADVDQNRFLLTLNSDAASCLVVNVDPENNGDTILTIEDEDLREIEENDDRAEDFGSSVALMVPPGEQTLIANVGSLEGPIGYELRVKLSPLGEAGTCGEGPRVRMLLPPGQDR